MNQVPPAVESAVPTPSIGAAVFASMRPPFLTLPPVCVVLGAATARYTGQSLDPWRLALILIGALAAHISVNALNEYHDFRSGLDFQTRRTPFSGGSGSLPAQPSAGRAVLAAALVALALTAGIGVYLIPQTGLSLVPLGVAGLVVIAAYTTILTRSAFWCLIAPGLGFGPFMVIGTHLALGGDWSATVVLASLVPFFLVSNLLLINQFPDAAADRGVGRRHLIIVRGVPAGVRAYTAFLALNYVAIASGVATGALPVWSLLGLLTIPLAARVADGLRRYAEDTPRLVPFLGQNVLIVLLTPVLVAVGLFIG